MNILRTRLQTREAQENRSDLAYLGGIFDDENFSNISISNCTPTSGVDIHLACNNHFQELLLLIAEKDEQIRTLTSRVAELESAVDGVLSFCPHLNDLEEDLPLFAARFGSAVVYSLTLTFLQFSPFSELRTHLAGKLYHDIHQTLAFDEQGPKYSTTLCQLALAQLVGLVAQLRYQQFLF